MHLSMSSPREEGGGGGSGNPREFDCDVCPQGEDFDHLIFQLQRVEEPNTILLTIVFCPGVGSLIIFFFKNVKIPNLCPTPPPPLGLDIYRCIMHLSWGGSRGGSAGSVKPPKLNVKTYNKHMVKMEVTLEQLNHFKLPLKMLEIAFQRP